MKKIVVFKDKVKRVGDHRKLPLQNKVAIFIDKKIPKKYVKSIVYHEMVEDKLQRQYGCSYDEAHEIAQRLERMKFFNHNSKEWQKENVIVNKIYRRNNK